MSVKEQIEQNLKLAFDPAFLEVTNESFMHSVPIGSESHFKVVIVSQQFEGKFLLKRHWAVNEIISEQIKIIRACALHTFTPEEWKQRSHEHLASPSCVGGSKSSPK